MLTAAFATADGVHVDAHFGRCARFDIYDIAAHGGAATGNPFVRQRRC